MDKDMGALSGSREPGLASRPGPAGFDPERIAALADYMRRAAKNHSNASRILAQTKSLRQAHDPPRDDLYIWSEPEQTVEWEIAGILDALAAGSRRAKTPQAVECEASQSGAKPDAHPSGESNP
jgi:hypothetical protein